MIELNILLATAVSIAFVHTLIGIDHYVPFIALSQANNWSTKKTLFVVFVCGIGHVLSSVVLGFAGIALSAGVSLLIDIENIRGEIATYFLIAFGLAYTVYGIKRSRTSHGEHAISKKRNVFWGLFVLFVLGPCEPLIPVLMYPAAVHNTFALVLVTVCFAVCTIATMLLMTFLGMKGLQLFRFSIPERYTHVLAGSAVLVCGITLLVLPI